MSEQTDVSQPDAVLEMSNEHLPRHLEVVRNAETSSEELNSHPSEHLAMLNNVASPVVVVRKINKRKLKRLISLEKAALSVVAQKSSNGVYVSQLPSSPLWGWSGHRPKDPWFLLTLLVASLASILALVYFFNAREILLLGDTYSHMLIARRLFDNITPGIAQIGGVWLPLPHLLMVPFVWNNYLWNTGLAGSFVAMPCYVISSCYIFLTARRLTQNNPASFVGTLVFILNPNILYLQITPLSELVLIATLTMAAYYFLLWAGDDSLVNLIRAAACVFLATLARYDGWPVFFVMFLMIVVIGRLRRHTWARTEANLIIFALLGGLGIVLWCVWCAIIFKDPLYWQHSMFSSQAQQNALPQQLAFLHTNNILFDYHNVWQSLRTYTLDSIYNVGLLPCILLVISIVIFYLRKGLTPEKIALLVVVVPFPFYVFSLFMGQAVIFVPRSAPPHATPGLNYYNVRYGVEMVAPVAIFVATLASSSWKFFKSSQYAPTSSSNPLSRRRSRYGALILQVSLSIIIVVQSILMATGGIISLQEGQFGFDCSPVDPVVLYMIQHYNRGLILSDTFSSGTTTLGAEAGVDFKNMIYEGSGTLWTQALANPASTVDWVIANPDDPKDLVARTINVKSVAFLSQFTLELQEGNGIEVFHRDKAPALASNAVPDAILIAHRQCPTSL